MHKHRDLAAEYAPERAPRCKESRNYNIQLSMLKKDFALCSRGGNALFNLRVRESSFAQGLREVRFSAGESCGGES